MSGLFGKKKKTIEYTPFCGLILLYASSTRKVLIWVTSRNFTRNSTPFAFIIRVIRKVRKTQHQKPEFDHTQGANIKKTCKKKYISIQGGDETQKTTMNFGGKLSFIVSFLFHERLHCCYIHFTALNCATTIIGLEPCALNAEYQQFHTEIY